MDPDSPSPRLLGLLVLTMGALFYFLGLIPFETKEHAQEVRIQFQRQLDDARQAAEGIEARMRESERVRTALMERVDRLTQQVTNLTAAVDQLEIDSAKGATIYRRNRGGQ